MQQKEHSWRMPGITAKVIIVPTQLCVCPAATDRLCDYGQVTQHFCLNFINSNVKGLVLINYDSSSAKILVLCTLSNENKLMSPYYPIS